MRHNIAILLAIAVVVLLALAGYDQYNTVQSEQRIEGIFQDISSGNLVGGSVSEHYQIVCLTADDAYRSKYGAYGSGAAGAQDAILKKLMEQYRCTVTSETTHFEMTAEGMEQFQTPHGQINLWPASGS